MILLFTFVFDAFAIFISYLLAYIFKFKISFEYNSFIVYGNFNPNVQFEAYLQVSWLVIFVTLVSLIIFGAYRERKGILSGVEEFLNIGKSTFFATVLIVFITFFYRIFPGSRSILIYTLFIECFFIFYVHHIMFRIKRRLKRDSSSLKNALIIGTGQEAQQIYEKLFKDLNHEYNILGAIGPKPKKILYSIENVYKCLGEYPDILKIVYNNKVNTVYFAVDYNTFKSMQSLIDILNSDGIEVQFMPNILSLTVKKISINDQTGFPLISLTSGGIENRDLMIKQNFDRVIALILLILCSPLLLIISVLIKIFSKGKIFYMQERVGLKGKVFTMIKFRTMPENIEQETGPTINSLLNKKRADRIGALLRKTSLDELPQLFNIIKGDMCFVGPRPERPFFVKKFIEEYPEYNYRHLTIPGITGWAQINGRSALSERVDEKVMYDIYYINNWSFGFDLKIFIKTIIQVFLWQGAY